jgi:hypothetical protein
MRTHVAFQYEEYVKTYLIAQQISQYIPKEQATSSLCWRKRRLQAGS